MSAGYVSGDGHGQRPREAVFKLEGVRIDVGVLVPVQLGLLDVIMYIVDAKVKLLDSTANALVLFVFRDSTLLRNSAIDD